MQGLKLSNTDDALRIHIYMIRIYLYIYIYIAKDVSNRHVYCVYRVQSCHTQTIRSIYVYKWYIYIHIYIYNMYTVYAGFKVETRRRDATYIYIYIIYIYLYIYVCSEVATHRRDATHISAQIFSCWWSFDPVYTLLSDLYYSDYKNIYITRKLSLSVTQIQNICGTNTSKYFLAWKMNSLIIIFSVYTGLCEYPGGKLSTKD